MPDADIPPFAQAAAGATGSIVSNTIVYPLDLVSTRVQTSRSKQGSSSSSSTIGALSDIVRKKGIAGLYQGLGTDNLSNTLSNFLFFFFRAAIVARLVQGKLSSSPPSPKGKRPAAPTLTPGQDLAAGALAGILSRACTTPLSNVTVRKQTHSSSSSSSKDKEKEKGKENGGGNGAAAGGGQDADSSDDEDETTYEDEPALVDIIREIVKDKGVLGLWSGFETAVLLSITPALTFYLTNIFSRLFLPRSSRQSPNPAQIFFTSALGNAASTTLVYPLILAKTLLQYRDPRGRRVYGSLLAVLRGVTRKRGVGALYRGLESQLTKGVISHGVTMMVKSRVEEGFVKAYLATKRRGSA